MYLASRHGRASGTPRIRVWLASFVLAVPLLVAPTHSNAAPPFAAPAILARVGMSDARSFTALVSGTRAGQPGSLQIEGRTLVTTHPLRVGATGYRYSFNLADAAVPRFTGPVGYHFCVARACRSGLIPLPAAVIHGVLGDMAGLLGAGDPYPSLLQAFRAAGYADTGPYLTLAYVTYPSATALLNLLDPNDHLFAQLYGDGVADFAARYLAPTVTRLLTNSYAARVDLVGHSMGGLVARAYVAGSGSARRVHVVVLLGAPNLGSVATFEELGPAVHLPRTARDLLPAYPFLLDAVSGRYLAPPLANLYLPALNRLRPPAGIRVYSIYARDFATTSVLLVHRAGYQIVGRIAVPGDGTVTTASAVLPGSHAIAVADGVRHRDLPSDPHVQSLILAALAGSP